MHSAVIVADIGNALHIPHSPLSTLVSMQLTQVTVSISESAKHTQNPEYCSENGLQLNTVKHTQNPEYCSENGLQSNSVKHTKNPVYCSKKGFQFITVPHSQNPESCSEKGFQSHTIDKNDGNPYNLPLMMLYSKPFT